MDGYPQRVGIFEFVHFISYKLDASIVDASKNTKAYHVDLSQGNSTNKIESREYFPKADIIIVCQVCIGMLVLFSGKSNDRLTTFFKVELSITR